MRPLSLRSEIQRITVESSCRRVKASAFLLFAWLIDVVARLRKARPLAAFFASASLRLIIFMEAFFNLRISYLSN